MTDPSANHTAFIDALVAFIRHELLDTNGPAIDADTYLFEPGVIDSLKILRLIAFVENWLGTAIPDSQIVMANFRSVRNIAQRFLQ